MSPRRLVPDGISSAIVATSDRLTSGSTSGAQDRGHPSMIGGRYAVERVLGRGGMATVYLCRDTTTDEIVAVKVLREEIGSAVIVERFLREIEFASELDHPRIPKVLDSGVSDGLPFYVMTYIEGESLRARLDRMKQLPVEEAVRITSAIIEPMTYAHRLGIVHRDIKPANILVGDESVHVLDFGIARAILASAEDRLTSTGVALGTPAYMSPEQALADKDLDARSDIYSLACVTYEMIAGIPPFVGATPQAVMARRFASPPPPLRETRDGVPENVEVAVKKALSRSPADRWQTARQFADALVTPTALGTEQHVQSDLRRRRRIYASLIAATVAGALLIGIAVNAVALARDPVRRAASAFERADLATAEREAGRALAEQPADPNARLLMARTLRLRGRPASEWSALARFSSDELGQMSGEDRVLASGYSALAAADRSTACDSFRKSADAARARNAAAFTAALEYADCLADDSTVVSSAATESGYSFRSSYAYVDSIYRDILRRRGNDPGAYSLIVPRLERVTPIHRGGLRFGRSADRKVEYRGLPSLSADTLAFVPYQFRVAGRVWKGGDPALTERALSRSRATLRELTRRWTELDAENPDAHAAASRVLEAAGQIDGPTESAFNELLLARRHQKTKRDTTIASYLREVRLGLDQVRLALKLRRFAAAGVVADSILALSAPAEADGANRDTIAALLANFAALRGRAGQVIDFGYRFSAVYPTRLPDGERINLPPAIGSQLIRLDALAAFGGDRDSIHAIAKRIDDEIRAVMPPTYAGWLSTRVLSRPLSLAAPIAGTQPLMLRGNHDDPFARALAGYHNKDVRRVRSLLDSLAQLRSTYAPGEITMDVVFTESWLRSVTGDEQGAAEGLDRALRGLSVALPNILRNPTLTASLVRAMALRAQLARRTGDGGTARYWADAVLALWGSGDEMVQPTVNGARAIKEGQ